MGKLKAGIFDRTLKLYQPVETTNEYNEKLTTYSLFATIKGAKETPNTQNKETFEADMLTGKDLQYFLIRYKQGITRKMIIESEGNWYNIHTLTEIGRREGYKILVEQLDQPVTVNG